MTWSHSIAPPTRCYLLKSIVARFESVRPRYLVILALIACGRGAAPHVERGTEVVRLPDIPLEVARTGNYLVVRTFFTVVVVSLESGASRQLAATVGGAIAADADGAYWGGSDGLIATIDPEAGTLTPLVEVGDGIHGLALNATHLLAAVSGLGAPKPLAWIRRDSGEVTFTGEKAFVSSNTAMAIVGDTGYVATSSDVFDETRPDGRTHRTTVKGDGKVVCAFGERLVTVHLLFNSKYRLRSMSRENRAPAEERWLPVRNAYFACGSNALFVLDGHAGVVSRVDVGGLVPVVTGKAELGRTLFIDDEAVYWGERDAEGWALRRQLLAPD
jgi:hypothetical protein